MYSFLFPSEYLHASEANELEEKTRVHAFNMIIRIGVIAMPNLGMCFT